MAVPDRAVFEVDHERIAHLALSTYLNEVPPRGAKPGLKSNNRLEWTVLAAFVLSYPSAQRTEYALISLGTGLKCLPYTSLPLNGDVLHDQHAEVLARRGARQWLLQRLEQQVKSGVAAGPELFEALTGLDAERLRWKLKANVRLHIYVSTLPCGDASSKLLEFQRAAQDQVAGRTDALTPTQLLELHLQAAALATNPKGDSSLVRGRASSSNPQPSASGSLRTKPGRPDSPPSICMSCSDKIALWNAPGVGLQGSLLSALLEPIRLCSVTLCDHPTRHVFPTFSFSPQSGSADQKEALKRLLAQDCRRALQRAAPALDSISVGWSTTPFVHSKEAQLELAWATFLESNPLSDFTAQAAAFKADHEPASCPNSIVFVRDPTLRSSGGKVENLASGTKMGAPTKRAKAQRQPLKPPARSSLCRLNAFQSFVAAYASITGRQMEEKTALLYSDAKEGAFGHGTIEYRKRKAQLMAGKGDAEKQVQIFLAGARDGTAIQALLSSGLQESPAEEEGKEVEDASGIFKKWLRTPAAFSHFDLQGQASHSTPAFDVVSSSTSITPETSVKKNIEVQIS